MQKKLTITVDEAVYDGLYQFVGAGKIGKFLQELARPHVVRDKKMESAYAEMAADELREKEASGWSENLISVE